MLDSRDIGEEALRSGLVLHQVAYFFGHLFLELSDKLRVKFTFFSLGGPIPLHEHILLIYDVIIVLVGVSLEQVCTLLLGLSFASLVFLFIGEGHLGGEGTILNALEPHEDIAEHLLLDARLVIVFTGLVLLGVLRGLGIRQVEKDSAWLRQHPGVIGLVRILVYFTSVESEVIGHLPADDELAVAPLVLSHHFALDRVPNDLQSGERRGHHSWQALSLLFICVLDGMQVVTIGIDFFYSRCLEFDKVVRP